MIFFPIIINNIRKNIGKKCEIVYQPFLKNSIYGNQHTILGILIRSKGFYIWISRVIDEVCFLQRFYLLSNNIIRINIK